ncbi:MAG: aspartate kinase [Flavobacteriaceae bacterium]|jgi:aspartate kinase|nr:aspartate kinase [Flavobacteriaceae bacterium]MDP4674288.1 aspartate kinase [Flavobacteriaceae bacterium]MDP4754144.1 aspartate kinase [Flavobacteriaceae bacterium]MDP4794120.1 aspartate kinase [Flavobacteriaceae bacterium]MDP4885544.1 aspartate kinase [Flavobacteriaceae bacterium]
MRVFKFGGASVKDAAGVRNVAHVLREMGHDQTLVVVSAMGKTTNAMEELAGIYMAHPYGIMGSLEGIRRYHMDVVIELFPDAQHPVYQKVAQLFLEIEDFFKRNKSPKYNFVYDQIVGYGELLSSTILSEYLNAQGLENQWIDVRGLIKTDNHYRDAQVDWEQTALAVQSTLIKGPFYITQGFLGSDENHFTTTLGREGSDYTAAILAYCMDAESVTIWKDVPGVLNADPRYFDNAQLLHHISYREAIELAFYGASVIHPKTLQPLQGKLIPLHVKSFIDPHAPGTTVSEGEGITPMVPCFIVKKEQVLLKLYSRDFSFIVENSMSELFRLFHQYNIKVELIQNSAISFSVCVDNRFKRIEELLEVLEQKYKVTAVFDVSLYTVRHFDEPSILALQKDKEILLEQRGKETVQLVVA